MLGRFSTSLLIQLSKERLVTVARTTQHMSEGWQLLGLDIDIAIEA